MTHHDPSTVSKASIRQHQPRTSQSHPLQIATIAVRGGAVGVTFCPGKHGDSVHGAPWARDLEVDLDAVQDWGASVMLTLVEDHELQSLGVPALGARAQARGMRWLHLPISDLQAPGPTFDSAWPAVSEEFQRLLEAGGRVLVHCRGGLGRAGNIAARILVDSGMEPAKAMKVVREARPGSIETRSQERDVLNYKCPAPRHRGGA